MSRIIKIYRDQHNHENEQGHYVKAEDAEAALAVRDTRIKELEDKLELAYCGIDELLAQHEYCDCSDDPTYDICIGCNLKAILEDMRKPISTEALEGK